MSDVSDTRVGLGLKATPIAIIGVAAVFAQAHDVDEYWDNILDKVDCIADVPPSRWSIDDYYDPDPAARDKVYCKRGGFLPDINFDPMAFGIPPNILEVTDVSQLLSLVVARDLLTDAGYGDGPAGRSFDRSRVGVVLGVAGGQKLITPLTSRLQYPIWERVLSSYGIPAAQVSEIVDKIKLAYPEWNENAFPGLLGNVIAGRVANRFDLGGMNCTVDAACASSLGAIKVSISQLLEGRADMMVTGGVDTDNSPFTFMCFSKTPAFTKGDAPRPFDADADGMMVGEGIGMLMLKRLADADRDGDHVYAVIRGIGASSDGRFKSIYAPRPEGQAMATRRAYEDAGVPPQTVGLVEAHGTGTKAGDPAEFEGLKHAFGDAEGQGQHIALGSVKSQIGHTKAAAGAAGMIKAALALDHKVLPPTINVVRPNPKLGLESSPFYINTETRPWIRAEGAVPRRAGVSAFGFGGTNYHVVLEERAADHTASYRRRRVPQAIVLQGRDVASLSASCETLLTALSGEHAAEAFADAASAGRAPKIPHTAARLGFVASSPVEAGALLSAAVKAIRAQPDAESWDHPKGVSYRREAVEAEGGLVALFPGQGSQYVNMAREMAINFPPVRGMMGRMDALFAAEGLPSLSSVVYPPPAFDPEVENAQTRALRATDYAQAAIGMVSAGMFQLLSQAGFRPDYTAGHSFGELSALWAGGVLADDDFMRLVKARGKAMRPPEDPDFDAGGMAAVQGALPDVEREIAAHPDVIIANQNSGSQVVLAGPTSDIKTVAKDLTVKGLKVTVLPVSAAFHTPLVGHASAPFAEAVGPTAFHASDVTVYSNTTGDPYPQDQDAARELLANHILNPVLFKRQIEAIYEAGGRVFVEVGPRRIATGLVEDILAGQPFVAVALNPSRSKSSDRQFREAVVQLRVAGVVLGNVDPYEKKPGDGIKPIKA